MLVGSRALAPDPARDERVAVRAPGGELTFRQLREQAAAVACGLGERNRSRPDVAVLSDGTPGFLACFLGVASAGRAAAVLDPSWRDPELAGALAQVDAPVALVAADQAARIIALESLGYRTVGRFAPGWSVLCRTEGVLLDCGPAPAADPDDVFYVGFTSGSAGRPKAFARTHRSWWASFERFGEVCPLDPDGAVLVPGPLASSHFLFGAVHALHIGATVELRPLTANWPRARPIGLDGAGAVYVVPTMLAQLAESAGGDPAGDPDWIFCAGARLDEAVIAAARRRFPASRLVEYYGASELSFVAIRQEGDGTPAGSVGRAFPGVEIRVCDEDDRPLAPGRAGTIFVRSDLVFAGYRGEPPASAARTSGGGWWTVGDRGMLDAAGHLYVAGRGSSLIITGGANVQPEEVEQVLAGCPGVGDCVVVGTPDPTWGQIVCAAVVPRAGAELRREDLRRHAAGALARHKRPRRYVRLDPPVPVGRTGKVDRDAVRALVMDAGPTREIR